MANEINKRIVMYRKLLGLSQSQIAERMGMKSSTYSQMERGGSITCDRILLLSKIFSVPVQNLLSSSQDEVLRDDILIDDPKLQNNIVLSKKEENFIKIMRNLPKEDKNEVIEFLQSKYKKAKIKESN